MTRNRISYRITLRGYAVFRRVRLSPAFGTKKGIDKNADAPKPRDQVWRIYRTYVLGKMSFDFSPNITDFWGQTFVTVLIPYLLGWTMIFKTRPTTPDQGAEDKAPISPKISKLAIMALVLAIIALAGALALTPILSIAAIFTGHLARLRIRQHGIRGMKMALVSLALAYSSLVVNIVANKGLVFE